MEEPYEFVNVVRVFEELWKELPIRDIFFFMFIARFGRQVQWTSWRNAINLKVRGFSGPFYNNNNFLNLSIPALESTCWPSHPLLLVLFIVLIKRIRVADCVNKLSWFFNIFQSSRHQLMTYFTSEWFSVAYCCIWQPLLFIPVLKTIARWPSVRCVSNRLFQTRRDGGSCP